MNLHGQIINIQADHKKTVEEYSDRRHAYIFGHRDARHAAAELAMKADACIEALRMLVASGNEFKSFDGDMPAWHVKSIPRDADLNRARGALAALDGRAVG